MVKKVSAALLGCSLFFSTAQPKGYLDFFLHVNAKKTAFLIASAYFATLGFKSYRQLAGHITTNTRIANAARPRRGVPAPHSGRIVHWDIEGFLLDLKRLSFYGLSLGFLLAAVFSK